MTLGRKCKPCFGDHRDGHGNRVCSDCMDEHYCACNSCGEMWHEDRIYFDEEQGGLCLGCSGDGSGDGSDGSDNDQA